MSFSPQELRESIVSSGCDHPPLYSGFQWKVQDSAALAHLVAWTMQGHYLHAESVLAALTDASLSTRLSVKQQAVRRLTLPVGTEDEPARWHRDGLIFQHIAWLVAQIRGGGKLAASMPHMRPAHKGFDAILIPLDGNRAALSGLIICEEKATTNPRNEISQSVWPEIASIEAGERDAEINGELATILRSYQVRNLEQVLADVHWLNHKSYRVSITVEPSHETEAKRRRLFNGFDEKAPGLPTRRIAETLAFSNLRDWMDTFAAEVCDAIQNN